MSAKPQRARPDKASYPQCNRIHKEPIPPLFINTSGESALPNVDDLADSLGSLAFDGWKSSRYSNKYYNRMIQQEVDRSMIESMHVSNDYLAMRGVIGD